MKSIFKKYYNVKNYAGFTVVELLIYMTVFSAFILVLTSVFTSVLDSQLESQSISDVEADGRFILLRLNHDLLSASGANAVTQPAALGQQGSTLQLNIGGQTYTYTVSNNNLLINNADQLNSYETTLSNVNFLRLGGASGSKSVQISFTVTDAIKQKSGQDSKTFQTTVVTRQ